MSIARARWNRSNDGGGTKLICQRPTRPAPVACFGASTGAAAALIAAADRPEPVRAVISRGGRPDLAGYALPKVQAPTLLIVGGDDEPVIELNRAATRRMHAGSARNRARCHTSVRGAWCAGVGLATRSRVVHETREGAPLLMRDVPSGESGSCPDRLGREHVAWLATVHVAH